MNFRSALRETLQFFTVFTFFAAAVFFFSLPYLPKTRFLLSNFLLSRCEVFTLISLGFFLAALILFVGFYNLNKGKFLRIEMGKSPIEVDSRLIFETIEAHFKRENSSKISLLDVNALDGKKLEISVSFDETSFEEKRLADIEKSLALLLRNRFGYSRSFHLVIKDCNTIVINNTSYQK